jgi:hypothetical protein
LPWRLHTRSAHLLRLRDAFDYQTTVHALGNDPAFKSCAQKICENQLLAIAGELHAELGLPFSRLYDSARVMELEVLVKQRES